jgi:hypothetical protein
MGDRQNLSISIFSETGYITLCYDDRKKDVRRWIMKFDKLWENHPTVRSRLDDARVKLKANAHLKTNVQYGSVKRF